MSVTTFEETTVPNAQVQRSHAESRPLDEGEAQFLLIYVVSYPLFLAAEVAARAWRGGLAAMDGRARPRGSVFAEASAAARSTIATALAD
jgi:hypothetical protein